MKGLRRKRLNKPSPRSVIAVEQRGAAPATAGMGPLDRALSQQRELYPVAAVRSTKRVAVVAKSARSIIIASCRWGGNINIFIYTSKLAPNLPLVRRKYIPFFSCPPSNCNVQSAENQKDIKNCSTSPPKPAPCSSRTFSEVSLTPPRKNRRQTCLATCSSCVPASPRNRPMYPLSMSPTTRLAHFLQHTEAEPCTHLSPHTG